MERTLILIEKHQMSLLVSIYFFLLPIGKTLWLPLLVMCFFGLGFAIRDFRSKLGFVSVKYLLITAFLIYFPALLSLSDSLVPSRTLEYLLIFPLFTLCGYFIFKRIEAGETLAPLMTALVMILLLWSCAMYIQFFIPNSIFGPPTDGRYQGFFGEAWADYWIVGYIMAPVLPLIAAYYFQEKKIVIGSLVFLVLAGACVLSGNRASWVTLLLCVFAVPLYFLASSRAKIAVISVACLLTISAISGAYLIDTAKQNPLVSRMHTTLDFFINPSLDSFSKSSGNRGEIWLTSIDIGLKNPFNGTGVANFRYAYPYYAPADTFWRFPNSDLASEHKYTGAMHPHQLILQMFASAGVPGLIGILGFYVMLAYLTFRVFRQRNLFASGAAVALWVGYFPFNTHLNFYGSWLTANFWVLSGLFFGLYAVAERLGSQQVKAR